MPRETIRREHPDQPYAVKVGWTRDLGVQVGVERDGPMLPAFFHGMTAELGNAARCAVAGAHGTLPDRVTAEDLRVHDEAIGQAMVELLEPTLSQMGEGVWADLERPGLNDLIRVLRRARDQAYGRDE